MIFQDGHIAPPENPKFGDPLQGKRPIWKVRFNTWKKQTCQ
jgi:hypothetical protein